MTVAVIIAGLLPILIGSGAEPHVHRRLIHAHPHYPDLHHRHGHG